MGAGTVVKLRHEGFAGHAESCAAHGQGWIRVLGWMQAFIETGETVETRKPNAPPGELAPYAPKLGVPGCEERYFTPFSGSQEPCNFRTKTIWPIW